MLHGLTAISVQIRPPLCRWKPRMPYGTGVGAIFKVGGGGAMQTLEKVQMASKGGAAVNAAACHVYLERDHSLLHSSWQWMCPLGNTKRSSEPCYLFDDGKWSQTITYQMDENKYTWTSIMPSPTGPSKMTATARWRYFWGSRQIIYKHKIYWKIIWSKPNMALIAVTVFSMCMSAEVQL